MERVTIASLAKTLGLSKASVSYALNGRPGVSDETRARVRALADELGWHASSNARALARAEAGVIGVVMTRTTDVIGTEPYFMRLISGIESVLITRDMSLLIRVIGSEDGRDLDVYQQWAAERRVDGVILTDLRTDDGRIGLLDSIGMPWVLHGEPGQDAPFVWVGFDNDLDAFMAIDHFRQLGHRSVAYVSGPLGLAHENRRIESLTRYASEAGIRLDVIESDLTLEGGVDASERLMASESAPTAVLYGNDLMSLGGLSAFRTLGIQVPLEVSVLSWHDSMLCGLGTRPVTALRRSDAETQGRICAELLLDLIAGGRPKSVMAPRSDLVLRGSTAIAFRAASLPFVRTVN